MTENLNFKYSEPRSLPVILLLDTSGSMKNNGNIDVLNGAVRDMLHDFAGQNNADIVIKVAIYTFGPDAKQFLELMPAFAAESKYTDMTASGQTPLGGALNLVKNRVLEDKNIIPARDYRPTVVLVSDGMPNDNWAEALKAFVSEGRSSKCYRMAMGIGVTPGTKPYEVLEKFVSDRELVFSAEQTGQIKNFFKYVSLSTISRVTSENPNVITSIKGSSADADDDIDFPF